MLRGPYGGRSSQPGKTTLSARVMHNRITGNRYNSCSPCHPATIIRHADETRETRLGNPDNRELSSFLLLLLLVLLLLLLLLSSSTQVVVFVRSEIFSRKLLSSRHTVVAVHGEGHRGRCHLCRRIAAAPTVSGIPCTFKMYKKEQKIIIITMILSLTRVTELKILLWTLYRLC